MVFIVQKQVESARGIMYFAIIGAKSRKALDASGTNIGKVVLWDYHGGDNQLWYWEEDVLRN